MFVYLYQLRYHIKVSTVQSLILPKTEILINYVTVCELP